MPEHLVATSTHAIDECICDAIVVVDEAGQGQGTLFGQRIFRRGGTRRHFGRVRKQRQDRTKGGLAGGSEAKEQERRRINGNRGMRRTRQ
jgi:hypothetical protein